MHPITRLLAKEQKRVVGLMSGTSVDGIDAALVEVEGFGERTRARLLAFETRPYSAAEKAFVHGLFSADTRALCEGNFRLGALFGDAALAVIARAGLRPADCDLVGSHGQTVWHHPPSAAAHSGGTASTLQIGEPAVIAASTGLPTVGDFRVADVAAGGEGAPLVPWADWALFRRPGKLRALQNIGGIANVTFVGETLDSVLAFDNGPGNVLADSLASAASHGRDEIDRDGAWSARGRVQDDVLAALLNDDFLRRAPPKSTGRERYGRAFAERFAAAHPDRSPEDLLATVVAFSAHAIARSYRDFAPASVDEVLVSGGGAHNRTLMAHLARLLAPAPVRAFGEGDEAIPADAKEAVAFAVLAVQAVHAEPANVPRATGASRPSVLGKICLP
jgi:anhydro-N-acetylmuramic acid kinase